MKIYKTFEFDVTNKTTGKSFIKADRKVAEHRCDYSGRIIDRDSLSYCSYECNYGDMDPCFGSSGEEFRFGEKYDVDMFDFLSQPYEFYDDTYTHGTYGNEETNMLKELVSFDIGEPTISSKKGANRIPTLESALRLFRIRVATKLIKDGVIKSEDLVE